ncbi:response regulator receiver protein [Thermodesulfatator indicus DSM 15286]|uniref:Response regulator receiver protein n=1 Tax=Thermodesulfatator indicus (strain DSM 15286 / JCM 11887 / CIR29812) TaxID=667014 RepID=F8AA03_THEID|nr:LytTR family DNA-binding domain-containing protein [Thermodesulfatator indicus]AEH45289.1 response regulator receiver protein [Thermodesulfatator indicus DSM 15286]
MIHIIAELFRNFDVGLVIFDDEFNIICVNDFIKKKFSFPVFQNSNLLAFHDEQAKEKIRKMKEEAASKGQSHSYILKIFNVEHGDEIFLLGKVFLLEGDCEYRFLAVLFDITFLTTDRKHKILKIPVYDGEDILFLETKDIEFFKAAGNYTEIFCQDKIYLCPLSLAKIEKFLDERQFFRIHRSYIVNLTFIERLIREGTRHYLLLRSKQILPISKGKSKAFLKIFGLK